MTTGNSSTTSKDALTLFGLQFAGAAVQAGQQALGLPTDTNRTEPDVLRERSDAQWDWRKTAMIAGAVVALAFALKFILKK